MSKLGLCISYDFGLERQNIDTTGSNYNEGTQSGIGSSHDTILMLFQNSQKKQKKQQKNKEEVRNLQIHHRTGSRFLTFFRVRY